MRKSKVIVITCIMLFSIYIAWLLYATEPQIQRDINKKAVGKVTTYTAGGFNFKIPPRTIKIKEDVEVVDADELDIYETNYTLYVNTTALNVRNSPDLNADIISKVYLNDLVNIIGEIPDNGDWVKINIGDGESAWVATEYLSGFQVQTEKPKKKTSGIVYNTPKTYDGSVLTPAKGAITGPMGSKETYYNLNMAHIVTRMKQMGASGDYWVRDDGVKMLGDYVMVAANLQVHPRGSLVDTSLGKGIVCDTGGFAKNNPYAIDIATNW